MNMRDERGFSFIEMITVLIILAILATVVMVRYRDYQASCFAVQCKSNQLSLEAAQIMYYTTHALEDQGIYATRLEDLYPYIIENEVPHCQEGGSYILHPGGKVSCTVSDHQR